MDDDDAARATPPDRGWSRARAQQDTATEELVDVHWHRPLAYWLLLRPWEHARWQPSPTQYTLGGGALGVLAAVVALAAPDSSPLWLLAALLLFVAYLLDCGGELLARLTGRASGRRALLDGMIDFAVGVSFWLAMSLRTAPAAWGAWAVPAALAIVLSVLVHTGLHDHLKLRFAVLTRPPPPPRAVAEPPEGSSPPALGLWARVVEGFFRFAQGFYELTYTNISRALVGVVPGSPRPDVDPKVARQLLVGPMRMVSLLGLGTHMALVYVATALAVFDVHLPFYVALVAVVVVLNLWAALAVLAWRRVERILAEVARHDRG